ncbi:aldo/keto reductase [Aestuariimicrobium ganziense]|uniref:aldo/keto reductase n=1 Tax=Aestuariimicrobium ganziense TaxID=2773677 RepID=UPI0019421886|nr:aldo/keto reductase [Aestuariimicrobium ganziense]
MSNTAPIRWGIIGPGAIAKDFRRGVLDSELGTLEAIASRNPRKEGLRQDFPEARIIDGYEAILTDPDVDAIYISTPHTGHAEWAIRAAEHGKHVLVEKPMALSGFEVDAVIHAHRQAGTFLGEAFMYRLHPQTQKLWDLIAAGTIGEVRFISAAFGYQARAFNPDSRTFASSLAGGGIMDVGCYPVSFARLVAGAAAGQPFLDPAQVSGGASLNPEGTDDTAAAVLTFDNGITAQVSCAVMANLDTTARIHGSEGTIEVPRFWFAGGNDRTGGQGHIEIVRPDGSREVVQAGQTKDLYAYQVDAACEAIIAGRQEFATPGMTWADSLGNARALDKWRKDSGIEFSVETAAQRTSTLAGRPLSSEGGIIPKRQVPGLEKPASALALGFEDFRTFSSGAILLDAFWEKGGNILDTAYVYGGGYTETLFGEWHTSRGVRDQAVLIGKGAHTPLCYPEMIGRQLDQSLERLQTDHVDVYFMHRDNLDVPVGEFVDAMDEQVRLGRIRGPFGGSNWTMERFDEAVAYAQANGKQAPQALSNNFALAEMLTPLWAGCVTSSTEEWKQWLRERQVANFSWSSQGRGFFTDRAGRDKLDNAELVRTWYGERNFARRDRAIALAEQLGKSPIHVALAYVLAQDFPSIPLIGPRTLAELDDSLQALEIDLTPDQVRWLEA